MTYQIIHSDCKEALKELIAKGIQVDSIVTDPPYELGFMGKFWDNTGISHDVELWQLALQILKPGGHLLAFSGSRTYHRMTCAIEDAGFEIRDQIIWIYGQGLPKSLDISKAIDKMNGVERTETYEVPLAYPDSDCWSIPNKNKGSESTIWGSSNQDFGKGGVILKKAPATELAKQWEGWGSALKPAHEPIVMARKPLSEKNIALNVIKHGTGAINIDGCRVEIIGDRRSPLASDGTVHRITGNVFGKHLVSEGFDCTRGRFPANIIHDGSDEVEAEFAKYGAKKSSNVKKCTTPSKNQIYGRRQESVVNEWIGDGAGSASRFFYSAKASKQDRKGSKHPTVKPIALMKYLCKLITPPGGIILDPFAGSGTTGQAAISQDFEVILIEKEAEYVEDIKRRMKAIPLTFWQLDKLNAMEKRV